MFRQRINPRNSLKFKSKQKFLKELPKNTIKTKFHRLKWVSMPIFLLITFGTIILFLININSYLRIITIYSITGFLTFFMAYFGWILAKAVIDKITDNYQKNENGILYYFRKLKKIWVIEINIYLESIASII